MSETKQLAAHYAVLQLDAHLHGEIMHCRSMAELLIEEFWEQYPQCERDPRQLDTAGKAAHAEYVEVLRKMRANALRSARTHLAARALCGRDKDDLPELDAPVMKEFRRLADAQHADELERQAKESLEEQRRKAKADDNAFDDALERVHEAQFDYANGEGPGPWLAVARQGGDR
jgi:hypothetical protein